MIQPLAIFPRRRLALAIFSALLGAGAIVSSPAGAAQGAENADRTTYVLFAPGRDSITMKGSTDDVRRARALRVGSEALLYVRDSRGAFVIRDAATLRRAAAIFEPQQVLGAQQAELGSSQAALGSRQAALGAQQARIGAQLASATPRRANELSGQMNALGRQQRGLGEQQAALGRQQAALGREQARLGREAEIKFRALISDAIGRGVAQRVS